MNATLIISTEYHANTPSVFAIIDNKYFGCQIYPNSRNYPEIGYWASATSSDSDRGFTIKTVDYSEKEFAQISKLQNAIFALEAIIPNQPNWPIIKREFTIRRGAKYEKWKAENEKFQNDVKAYFAYTDKFEAAKRQASSELRNILLQK